MKAQVLKTGPSTTIVNKVNISEGTSNGANRHMLISN